MFFLRDFAKTIVDRALESTVVRFLSGLKQSGVIKSDEEYRRELDRVKQLIISPPSLEVSLQSGRTDSMLFNDAGEKLCFGLQYLFDLYNELDRVTSNHCWLLNGRVADAERGLAQLSEQLALLPPTVVDGAVVVDEDLAAPRFVAGGDFTHADLDGTVYGAEYLGAFNGGFTLAPYMDRDAALTGSGYPLVRVKVERYVGVPLPQVEAPVEKIVDGQPVTAWRETVLSPSPIDVTPGLVFNTAADDALLYGSARGGAFCELSLVFKYPVTVTEFSIAPAAPYPMELVGLLVYEDQAGPGRLVARNVKLERDTIVRFPAVSCVRARFLVRQLHCERKRYFIPPAVLDELYMEQRLKEELWFPGIRDVEERNYREQFRGWEGLSFSPESPGIDQVCYEYVYGLREIGARERHYRDFSFMVSEPFVLPGDARTAELETEEEHPRVSVCGNDVVATSLEYFIECDGELYPIVPKGKNVVGERLFGPAPTLRFPVAGDLKLYRNGVPFSDFDLIDDRNLKISGYNSQAIYTADYIPSPQSYFVEFAKSAAPREFVAGASRGERFDGTDAGGRIKLSCTPYLDYSSLVDWRPVADADVPRLLVSTGVSPLRVVVAQGGEFVEFNNVTDYLYGTAVKPGDREFVHSGRDIIFASPINAEIIVYYKYIGAEVRLRAVMRRNMYGHTSLTGVLRRYRLRIHVAS
ncbi:MAG: hypothetical protein AB1330_01165 [Bacillota bacterium]